MYSSVFITFNHECIHSTCICILSAQRSSMCVFHMLQQTVNIKQYDIKQSHFTRERAEIGTRLRDGRPDFESR